MRQRTRSNDVARVPVACVLDFNQGVFLHAVSLAFAGDYIPPHIPYRLVLPPIP